MTQQFDLLQWHQNFVCTPRILLRHMRDIPLWFTALQMETQNQLSSGTGIATSVVLIETGDWKQSVMFSSVAAMLFIEQVVYDWMIFILHCFKTDHHHYSLNVHKYSLYFWEADFNKIIHNLQDFRFWHQCFRGFESSGVWHCVVGLMDAIAIEDDSNMVVKNVRSH
jgi:hypothetical protein